MREAVESWGRLTRAEHEIVRLHDRGEALPAIPPDARALPRGAGRSYGDAALNAGGILWDMTGLDRFLAFDTEAGIVRAEAGMSFAALLTVAVAHGWFPPVTPGTSAVTLGGALAADVHGKNHHRVGTFGRHVRGFELLRSDGTRRECTPEKEADLFAATIGGLGLTGAVIWIELGLQRVDGPDMDVETVPFGALDEFFALARESDARHAYSVAWIDAMTPGAPGVFQRANHAPGPGMPLRPRRPHSVPRLPVNTVRRPALRAFNRLYRTRHDRPVRRRTHFETFFYPLDGLRHWNRLYGPAGFHQYQCVVPKAHGVDAMAAILGEVARSGECCALGVLKIFGDLPSPGAMSFPMAGPSVALDFPNRGAGTHALFERLDAIVRAAGGRLYPAKDARMSGAFFKESYPGWRTVARAADPRAASDFWRRVAMDEGP